LVASVVSYEILKITILPYTCMVEGQGWPFTIEMYGKFTFLKLHNLWLMHPISSKLWEIAQDYGLDGYYNLGC